MDYEVYNYIIMKRNQKICVIFKFFTKEIFKIFFALLVHFPLISTPIFSHVGFIDKNFTVNWITCALSLSIFYFTLSFYNGYSHTLYRFSISSYVRSFFFFSFFKRKHYFRNVKSIFKISIFILSKIKLKYFKYKKMRF